jgi:GNAT superfamily N-acetyltransferase
VIATFEPLAPPLKDTDREALVGLLLDAVEGNASIGFPGSTTRETALDFWSGVEVDVAAGRALLFGSRSGGLLVATVQLRFSSYPNGRHRAEVAKLLVHSNARRHGLGTMLMQRVEEAAAGAGKSLLFLDTETGSAAEKLYRGLGWIEAGAIPRFAYRPDGALRPTTFFYKELKT